MQLHIKHKRHMQGGKKQLLIMREANYASGSTCSGSFISPSFRLFTTYKRK
jgi:hypothetical protein